ncbi:MAG: DUF1048 domain-containing protein [Lachnospiraceae bacterium]|nr:DUF1048 domain-containing protein [Lachnospiraceae bacterium]
MGIINYVILKEELEGEYKQVFDKVEVYSSVRNIDSKTDEEMMMNLLDMMLTAQKEGKPVEKIVGKDIETFCKQYFQDYDWKNRLQEIPKKIYGMMWVIFVLCLINLFAKMGEEGFHLLTATMDVAAYFVGLFGGFFIILLNCLVRPFLFRWKRLSSVMYSWLVIIVFLVLIAGGFFLLEDRELNVHLFPLALLSGFYVFFYIIIRAILRYQSYGSVRKPKEPFEQSMGESLMERVEQQMPLELVKRYEKKNRRLTRQGKEPVTPQDYTEKLRKESIATLKLDQGIMIVIILFCVGMGTFECIHSDVINGVILGSILLLCEIPVIMFLCFLNRGMKTRLDILKKCEKQGITILEYAGETSM